MPTAAKIKQACTVYVYYYIRGAENVEGSTAGVTHTFNDSDIQMLTVNVQPEPVYDVELNDATAEFINSDSLRLMKRSAVLINTARGGLVNEEALATALKEGQIAFACLDVLKKEPMEENCPLYGLDNCLITPHIAWTPLETRRRLLKIAIENLAAFLEGREQNRVV